MRIQSRRRGALIVIALLALLGMVAPASLTDSSGAAAQESAASWCVAAWYPSSEDPTGLESIAANLDVIDVIHPFWYAPLPDGTLQARARAEDESALAAWREAGLVILPTIFSGVWMMISDPATRAFHIEQIVALVEHMDYDGIDIDYEGFAASTRDDFSAFIEALAEALHARGRLLAIAVHAKTGDAGAWEGAAAQDWARLSRAVDIFTIMTYDFTNRNEPPGPISPPAWVLDVLGYAESITDLAHVHMGLHFYGYSWKRGRPPATATTWAATQRLIQSFNLTAMRDPADMEAWIDLDVRGLPRNTVYFADAVGVQHRLSLALDAFPTLGGVAIWGVGGEDPANWDVLRASRRSGCALRRTAISS